MSFGSRWQRRKLSDEFEVVKVYLPRTMLEKLKEIKQQTGVNISRLCAIAVDNEIERDNPFNFDDELPESVPEHVYAAEAGRILEYLSHVPGGLSVQAMVLLRRDMGMENKHDVLCGIAELIRAGAVRKDITNFGINKGSEVYKIGRAHV